MRQIALVRHGDLAWEGDDGAPLSSAGQEQCEEVGLKLLLLNFCPTQVFCSPLLRAKQSARIIARKVGLQGIVPIDNLTEVRPGETDLQVTSRVADALMTIYTKSKGNVVVVGHGGPLRLMIKTFWNLDEGIDRGKMKIFEME